MSTIAERIAALLAGLGDTCDKVAAGLRTKGITGIPSDGEHCPLARLIRREIPETSDGEWGWANEEDDGYWGPKGYYVVPYAVHTPDGEVRMPRPAQLWIEAFDNQAFSDLREAARAEA